MYCTCVALVLHRRNPPTSLPGRFLFFSVVSLLKIFRTRPFFFFFFFFFSISNLLRTTNPRPQPFSASAALPSSPLLFPATRLLHQITPPFSSTKSRLSAFPSSPSSPSTTPSIPSNPHNPQSSPPRTSPVLHPSRFTSPRFLCLLSIDPSHTSPSHLPRPPPLPTFTNQFSNHHHLKNV